MNKAQNTKIKFEPNTPVHVTLVTNPATAKENIRDTEWGVKKSYTIFVNDNRVMFATEALYLKLKGLYSTGDSIIINLIKKDGRTEWNISPAGERKVAKISGSINDSEALTLLRAIDHKLNQLLPQSSKEQENTKDGEQLGF